MTRYAEFDIHDESPSRDAAWEASSDPVNHWPDARYLGDGIESAAAHISHGLCWFGFWLAVGMVSLAYAWAGRT